MAIGTPAERRASVDPPTVITFRMPGGGLLGLPQLSATARMTGDVVRVESRDPISDTWRLTAWAMARWIPLEDLTVTPPTPEADCLELTAEYDDDR